jgi:hypothetical protein
MSLLKSSEPLSGRFSNLPSPPHPSLLCWVALFYGCFFLFFSSGRLSGGDPNDQLKATMLLAATGSPSLAPDVEWDVYNWNRAPNGRQYEAHDVGALLAMAPAALAGVALRQTPVQQWIERPPFFLKAAASLSYAVVSAAGAFFLFQLMSLFHGSRRAFVWSMAFVLTTPFWAFARCGFDVVGGASGVCLFLLGTTRLHLLQNIKRSDLLLAIGGLAAAASFRYSLLPALSCALLTVCWLRRSRLSFWDGMAGIAAFFLLMSPTFLYNLLRTGNPLKPATMAAKYLEGMNALTGSPIEGFYGMLLSPNWGLLFYSPQFCLLLAIPMLWHRFSLHQKQMSFIWIGVALAYLFPISYCVNWPGVVGWGSRYVVPILPVLFLLLAMVADRVWQSHRLLVLGLTAASFLINLPSGLVNWHEASLSNSAAPWAEQIRYHWALAPRQQLALWSGLLDGLQGKPLPSPQDWLKDPALYSIVAFPDIWTFKLMRFSVGGRIGGVLVSTALLSGCILAAYRIFSSEWSSLASGDNKPSSQLFSNGLT